MNKVSLGEIKTYLGIDGEEVNQILAVINSTAEHTVEKILRKSLPDELPGIIKNAILYIIWQLYFHRNDSEFNMASIERTAATMLSDLREDKF